MIMLHTKICYLRFINGLSQQELAQAATCVRSTLYFVESGKKLPRPATLKKIAKVFGLEVKDLFTEDLRYADGHFEPRPSASMVA